jgi:hypothetical protein
MVICCMTPGAGFGKSNPAQDRQTTQERRGGQDADYQNFGFVSQQDRCKQL